MEETLKLDLTEEEARAMDAQIEAMLAAMRKANEQMARDQREIERLKAETEAILADLQRRVGVTHVETVL
jgi:hypothetical protein